MGEDAFRTATGVHAAAVIKAFRKGDIELANSVYSGVPSHYFGLEQIIEIGPMSGKSNVIFWLERKGMTASEELVDRIFSGPRLQTAALRRRKSWPAARRFLPIPKRRLRHSAAAQLFSAARVHWNNTLNFPLKEKE